MSNNSFGFCGYINSRNILYGILCDPEIKPSILVKGGINGYKWEHKNDLEIAFDLQKAIFEISDMPLSVKKTILLPHSVRKHISLDMIALLKISCPNLQMHYDVSLETAGKDSIKSFLVFHDELEKILILSGQSLLAKRPFLIRRYHGI